MSTKRQCEIVTHIFDNDNNVILSKQKFIDIASTQDCIDRFAVIEHDRDVNDNGILKVPHIHALLHFKHPVQLEFISRTFGVSNNFIENIKGSWRDANAYLIHKNAPEKYQYKIEEVFANYNYKELIENISKKQNLDSIIEEILSGNIKEYQRTEKIDNLILVKNKRLIDNAFQVFAEKQALNYNRKLQIIYVYGDTGTGKTTLAKKICENNNLTAFISSGSNDPLYGYQQQEAIIFDDYRTSTLEWSDILKLCDLNTSSTVKSRYHNKNVTAQLIIFTSTISLEQFYNYNSLPNEPINQLKRRFSIYIHLTDDCIFIRKYNPSLKDYDIGRTYKNPVKNTIENFQNREMENILYNLENLEELGYEKY